MSQMLEVASTFPREEFLRLLQAAEPLYAAPERRQDLLRSLDLSIGSGDELGPIPSGGSVSPPAPAGPTAWHEGEAWVHFASRLADQLAEPPRLDGALKLARRIVHELGDGESWSPLLTTLEELYVRERTRLERGAAGADTVLLGAPPGPWMGFECVHTYSLTDRFFGREPQLARLDEWIAGNASQVTVLSLNALGGSGKSALAWQWLNRVLPTLPQAGYRGAFWCSFYEKDFDFGDFLRRALAFGAGLAPEAVALLSRTEVESRLLEVMRREPFIFVMDGLERLMNGYAVVFDRALDPDSIPGGKQEQEVTAHNRRLTDPRNGAFLRRLAEPSHSRILLTSRLGPADLEGAAAEHLLPHVEFIELGGLEAPDAAVLWSSLVPASAVTDELRAIFTLTGNHPLVISILARSVAASGGDWEAWRRMESHRDFEPRNVATEPEVRAHIIGVCLRDLQESCYDVLGVLTTSGKPMPMELLARVLLQGSAASGDDRWTAPEQVAEAVDRLTALGLVGAATVDGQTEYDVHPVVRGAAWALITDAHRERFLSHALSEFYATPDRQEEGIDLNKAMSLFQLLVRSGEIDRAWEMYYNKLWTPLALRSDNRTLLDLFALFLPDGDSLRLLPLASRREQANATEALGSLLMTAGAGDRSDRLLRWCGAIRLQIGDFLGFLNARHGRNWQTMYEGRLFETELDLRAMREDALHFGALDIVPAIDCWIGIVLALRGETGDARHYFELSRGRTSSFRWWAQGLAEGYVYLGEPEQALPYLEQARTAELHPTDGRMQVAWERLTEGIARFQIGALEEALDHLSAALQEALRANYSVIQCFATPYIAEILLRRGDLADAEAQLEAYFRLDPESRYQLAATDVWRVRSLALLARGDPSGARTCAERAYRLAACDGPPFLYREGVRRALEALERCGAYVPRTEARLHPEWRRLLGRFSHPVDGRASGEGEDPREGAAASARTFASEEEAREFLRGEALVREASENDRRWWAEITSETGGDIAVPLAQAMAACGISIESFRAAYEKSPYRSVLVIFHQLHAASIAGGGPAAPVGELDDAGRREWLAREEEHDRALAAFLETEHARRVGFAFEVHHLDSVGVDAFLSDDKRRIQYERGGLAREWWDRLERGHSSRDILVLAESIFLAGATLQEFVESLATGIPRGIEYAFASLRLKRAIASVTVDAVSSSESWNDVQVFLRLEDVKQRLGWRAASAAARDYWAAFEKRGGPRLTRALRVAEELAIRRGTIEDYHRAHLFTRSDDPDANLAHVEYERQKEMSWDGDVPRRPIALEGAAGEITDTSGWNDGRIRGRLEVVVRRIAGEDPPADVTAWWAELERRHPPARMLRLAEELDAVGATTTDLYRASVEGATHNPRAALAHVTFTRTQRLERRQAQLRAAEKNREGNAHYEAGRYREAIAAYQAAIDDDPEEIAYHTNLSGAWERVTDVEPAVGLRHAVAVLERAPRADSVMRELAAARNSLRLAELGGWPRTASMGMLPLVTPLAVEVSADLEDIVQGENGEVVPEVGEMRVRVETSTGVRIPGVRFRANAADLPPTTMLIMLDEVPMVMHSLSDQEGRAGRSIELFAHLERFIRQNLASFITLQSVETRLRTEWSDRAGEIAEDAGRLARLTRLLRSLVQERIPVLALPGICEAMLQGIAAGEDQDRILAAVRLLPALLPHLDPGEQAPLYALGPSIEGVIMDGLTPYGDERLLLLEPEPTQDILREIRNGLDEPPEHERPAILLVEDPICRRYVRRLVELEFPHLVVLARPELPPGREGRVVATLELE